MQKILQTVLGFIKAHRVLSVSMLIVAVGVITVATRGTPPPETITVHPATLIATVNVSGKVTSAHDVDLGFSQGGRVAHVYVAVGSRVAPGTLLAEVENGDLRAALQAEQATLDALKAGSRPEEVAVAEAEVVSDQAAQTSAGASAQTVAANAIVKIDEFFSSPHSSNPKITFQIADSNLQISLESKRAQIEPQLVKGAADLTAVSSLLITASQALARAIPNTSITQTTLDGYAADVASAKTSVDTASAAVTTATTALATAQKNLVLKKAGPIAEDLAAEEARVRRAEADLQKTLIVAPFGGTVTVVNAKVGGALSVASPAISMIGTDFQVESYVPEVNIASVAVGNSGSLTLDAYGSGVSFPISVISIDPAETVKDGVPTYRTILGFMNVDSRIRAGMTADVTIVTGQKENALAVPQGLVHNRDGKKYVTVLVDGKAVEKEVMTGMVSAGGMIEITSGLSDGDHVPTKIP